MIIVDKETLEVCDAEDLRNRYKHIVFDFTNSEIVGEVLGWIGKAILNMPDQPVFDARYQKASVGSVVENDGVYSSTWVLSPVDVPIAELAAIKVEEIRSACEAAITSGFYSEALGSLNFYSCDRDAQLNIQANLIASLAGIEVMHYCTDSNGVKSKLAHTPEQMKLVGESMGAHIWPNLDKADGLRIAIMGAVADNDVDALITVSW